MSAAKARKAKPTRAKAKKAKAKAPPKRAKPRQAKPKAKAPQPTRPFRFTAADTVQIRFPGEKKPENFHVDDMVEATLAALDGATRLHYQYRLVSNDKTGPGGAERHFWFFDPKPVGSGGPIGPSLWQQTDDETLDGYDVVDACSGNFSTRSVTSYDGSGSLHIVMLNDLRHRMRLDLNGKREFCDSLVAVVGKDDVLTIVG